MSERNILGSHRAHDVLTCRLCTQYLREPRQLPCGHSFCLQCLERYYKAECQRSETGRLRSPSVERRRRGLLPCPTAPVCLHVAVVPDDGVAAFPINQKIADIKEHVVNEMAYNISQRIGRSRCARAESDTASVRSDDTDFSDISCETTCSAPAAGSSDHTDGASPYPNLAKYAKYFEAAKDGSSDISTKYTPSLRSERRRVAVSSSFQHRRRRVHTPSPAAFDDSTRDFMSQQPSRCGSAPHLDSDGINYRPTVRPRQGSVLASPLLRRARPSSCIVEELADDEELLNHLGETTRPNETLRRTASTERRRQPLIHDHVLPTHCENIATDEGRRSTRAHDSSAVYSRHNSEDVKTGDGFSKTTPGQDDQPKHSKHHYEKPEASKNYSNITPTRGESSEQGKRHSEHIETCNNTTKTAPMPAQGEPARHHKHHSDYSETGVTSSKTVPVVSEPNKDGKHYSHNVETGSTSSNMAPTRTEPARSSKSHCDEVKTGKTSTSASSSRGRRVLPNIPTVVSEAKTFSGSAGHSDGGVHPETTTSNVHQSRQLPRTDKFTSTERHCASSLSHGQKDSGLSKSSSAHTSDPDKPKSSTASVSHPNKSRSSSTSFTEHQKTPDSRLSSKNIHSSRPNSVKSSLSDSVATKQSTSAKMHGAVHSKSSVSDSKSSSTRDSSMSQKPQDSGKLSADPSRSQSKSTATSSKVHSAERLKSSQHSGESTRNVHGSVSSKSAHKDEPSRAGSEQKERQSECSTADKSPSSKSTPGSGIRLTYKVNAATIQPVLMNSKKTKLNSPKSGHGSSVETATDESKNLKLSETEETVLSENVEVQEENSDVASSIRHSNDIKQTGARPDSATSNVSPQKSLNENEKHCGSPAVDKDCDRGDIRDAETSLPRSSESPQTDVNSETGHQSGTNKCHTNGRLSPQLQSATDDKTPVAADADTAADGNEDAKNDNKKMQWHDFMTILQAARAKYSSVDNHLPLSDTSRPLPVYNDSITPCWRIQRDDFAVPTSIAIVADGSAVIADVANCLLDFTDVEGNIVHSVTGTKPFSVAVGSDGNIYVGDRRSRTVRVFDTYGSDVSQWDAEAAGFGWIAGIAALHNGQLAIIDRERCKVSSKFYKVPNSSALHFGDGIWYIGISAT